MGFVNDDIIQRILTVSADYIQDTLYSSRDYKVPGVLLKCGASDASINKCLLEQQQLFADALYDSGETVNKLFADNQTPNSIETSYIIKNSFMFYYEDGMYSFDVDTVNSYNKGRFFISSLILKHSPRDAFTLKSNYDLSLKINFSDFDDLMENNVIAYNIVTGTTKQIPIMTLLYKFLNSSVDKEATDNFGVFLVQELYLDPNDQRYTEFISFNNNLPFITKNFHLGFKSHSFEVFRDNSPFYKIYENELTIEYTTFMSSDEQEKVPSLDGNLYNLVLREGGIKKQIKELEDNIEKVSVQLAECEKQKSINKETISNIQKKLDNLIKAKSEIVSTLNERLIETILDRCDKHRIQEFPYRVLNIYRAANWREHIGEIVGWGSLALGSALIGFTGVGLTATVAGLSVAGPAFYNAVMAIKQKKLVNKGLDFNAIRNAVKNKTITTITGSNRFKYGGNNVETFYDDKSRQKINKDFKKKYNEQNLIPILLEEERDKDVDIFFITFGDIVKLVKKDIFKKTNVIFGGYSMNIVGEQKYVSFANIPISLSRFSNFLYKYIIEQDRGLKYSADLFISDCYENLIKGVLYEAGAYLLTQKSSLSTNMKMATTIHSLKANSVLLKDTPVFPEAPPFINLKKHFLISKNLTKNEQGASLYKLIVVGNYPDSVYIDFYKKFRERTRLTEGRFSNLAFQKYIHEEHQIPCLLITRESKNENILKKKNITFTREDNPAIKTGNILAGSGAMRFPYRINAELKAFCAFFITPGSNLFVSPPSRKPEYDQFGYGGLYTIRSSKLEYNFQKIVDEKIILPNFESKYTIEGFLASTAINPNDVKKEKKKSKIDCFKTITTPTYTFINIISEEKEEEEKKEE